MLGGTPYIWLHRVFCLFTLIFYTIMAQTSSRDTFSKIGVILASVGGSVGLGNIWRFPYETGLNGGGAFLLVYLLCVFLLGIPVMTAEFVIGRGSHHGTARSFRKLAPNKKWTHPFGYIFILTVFLILGFYCVVSGWLMDYLFHAVSNNLYAEDAAGYSAMFSSMVANPGRIILWTVIFLIFNHLILLGGVQRGIEKIAKLMMPLFAVILIVFCIQSLRLPGTQEGLTFFFKPDFSSITPRVFLNALGQAFFSLSIGIGCMLVYSSYFSDETPLLKTSMTIGLLDTLVAVLAGVIIFPAVFSYGGEVAAGPKLIFEVLPSMFAQMPGGYFWSLMFFLLVFFAAITSSISIAEVAIAFFHEEFKMRRRTAVGVTTAIVLVLNVLCCLSFNVLSGVKMFGMGIFDSFDYLTSNILIPIAGLLDVLFVGWVLDKEVVVEQLQRGGNKSLWMTKPSYFLIKYVAPIVIFAIFLSGMGFLG